MADNKELENVKHVYEDIKEHESIVKKTYKRKIEELENEMEKAIDDYDKQTLMSMDLFVIDMNKKGDIYYFTTFEKAQTQLKHVEEYVRKVNNRKKNKLVLDLKIEKLTFNDKKDSFLVDDRGCGNNPIRINWFIDHLDCQIGDREIENMCNRS